MLFGNTKIECKTKTYKTSLFLLCGYFSRNIVIFDFKQSVICAMAKVCVGLYMLKRIKNKRSPSNYGWKWIAFTAEISCWPTTPFDEMKHARLKEKLPFDQNGRINVIEFLNNKWLMSHVFTSLLNHVRVSDFAYRQYLHWVLDCFRHCCCVHDYLLYGIIKWSSVHL